MYDFKQAEQRAKEQAKTVDNLIAEMNRQNRIFEQTIESAMKGAPESDKKAINKVLMISRKAVSLAKQGKLEEAQQLIKDFQYNGNKDS